MSTANDIIVHSLKDSMFMLKRFVEDLKPEEYLHRPTPRANCVAWLLGHLALTDRNVLQRLGAKDLPELPEGFDKRFSQEAGCPEASEFGDVSILMQLFEKQRSALISVVQRASLDLLDKPLEKPHPLFSTLGEMTNFIALHTAMHAGQVTIVRRSLGRPPLI